MNIIELILSIGSFNGLLIGGILLSLNNANRLATRVFGFIVILFSLVIIEELFEFTGWVFQYPRLLNIADSFILLIGPLFLIYAQLITEGKRRLIATDFFHSLAFVLFIVYLLPIHKLDRINYDPSGIVSTLKALITAAYLVYALRYIVLFERSQKIKAFPANNHQNIRWFRGLLISLVILGLMILALTFLFRKGVALPIDPDTFSVLSISVLFWGVSIKLMRNPFLFWSIEELDRASKTHFRQPSPEKNERYKTSPLTVEDLEEYMFRLKNVMKNERPYLNPELAPIDLEKSTGIKAYYISQVLNEVLNKNFYEFVNAYRIESVKLLILDAKNNHKTMLALALDSGFNSKSSFNRVFKQYTGMTPSQFKKKNRY